MDIQGIIESVTSNIGGADQLQEFIADPAAAIKNLTGEQLDAGAVQEVVKGVVENVQNNGDIAGQLSGLLENTPFSGLAEGLGGDAGKSIGDMIGGLFNK